MDIWFDIGMAAVLRVIKQKKERPKVYKALAKLRYVLQNLTMLDPGFARAYDEYVIQQESDR